eukprot:4748805-Amphidinium_carterae.1
MKANVQQTLRLPQDPGFERVQWGLWNCAIVWSIGLAHFIVSLKKLKLRYCKVTGDVGGCAPLVNLRMLDVYDQSIAT